MVGNWTNKTEIDKTVNYSVGLHCHPLNTPLLACRLIMQGEDAQKTVEK